MPFFAKMVKHEVTIIRPQHEHADEIVAAMTLAAGDGMQEPSPKKSRATYGRGTDEGKGTDEVKGERDANERTGPSGWMERMAELLCTIEDRDWVAMEKCYQSHRHKGQIEKAMMRHRKKGW